MRPEFGQAGVNLACDMKHCCLRARSAFARRIPQPPSPPEPKRTGPKRASVHSIPKCFRADASRPFFRVRSTRAGALLQCCQPTRLATTDSMERAMTRDFEDHCWKDVIDADT